jgi:signal transduction histidine kinase/HAMP domain-containing protein
MTDVADSAALQRLLSGMRDLRDGDAQRRLPVTGDGELAELAAVFNEVAQRQQRLSAAVTEQDELSRQLREIAEVVAAVARGDLSRKLDIPARGETLALKRTINTMVDQLSAFASEVTRVAREVGTDGRLGGQARVPGVAGIWKDLTDNVNVMAENLTDQVRGIAAVTTAVAEGDLSKKIDVPARGEILALKSTINTMVDQLSAFASEVTRVAREVGTEGKLGGQAEVADVSGTWRRLTENVNQLASNLTTQVRAIAAVATAVTNGDLTRQITVDAAGEVADLKDNINAMISNLERTTRTNREQDWLKTNLTRLSGMMQGQHDLPALTRRILSELAPLVRAQYGAFYLASGEGEDAVLERIAGYALPVSESPPRFRWGEALVGQAAADRQMLVVYPAPDAPVRISSGLGSMAPAHLVVLPVLFEGQALGAIELASVHEFGQVHLDLLAQLEETIGIAVNTIVVNSRTESLLSESQNLTQQLQRSNAELEEKAALLASRNRDIEIKNIEIEQARQELEDRAQQLSKASTYKSEFLANMSHELRTPLNSALIISKLLADNLEGNLTAEQVDLASTVHAAGTELLQLINDVLDLAKVESGHMDLLPQDVVLDELARDMDAMYRPLVDDKGLEFSVSVSPDLPVSLRTDRNRLVQVLRNLLSNAVKFTARGSVELDVRPVPAGEVPSGLHPARGWVVFTVRDTGVGIPAEKIPLVFEAFQQVDGTTVRKYGGTGLGLSISRELTTLLGGDLRVSSELDRGTTFSLYLPTTGPADDAEAEEGDGEPVVAEPDADQPPIRFHGEKVLVIDDDPRSVTALTAVLQQHGLRTLHADNGVSGISVLEDDGDVDAVLVDVMMPDLDGNATTRAIRAMPRYRVLPIIAVTAKATQRDREECLAAGATDCVTKPVRTAQLLRLLATELGA